MITLKSKFFPIQIDEILVINWGLKQLYLNLFLIAENKDPSIYFKKEKKRKRMLLYLLWWV